MSFPHGFNEEERPRNRSHSQYGNIFPLFGIGSVQRTKQELDLTSWILAEIESGIHPEKPLQFDFFAFSLTWPEVLLSFLFFFQQQAPILKSNQRELNMPKKKSAVIKLADIHTLSGLTKVISDFQSECASVCFSEKGHNVIVPLHAHHRKQDGSTEDRTVSFQRSQVTQRMRDSHYDLEVPTQHGACGISIVLVREFLGLVTVMSSRKGTGFDYYVERKPSKNSLLFQNTERLEVSGMLDATDRDFKVRVKEKIEQTKKSDDTKLPAHVVVVEFSTPKAEIVSR